MKKNPIKSGLRETMAGKVTFLFLLFLYTGVMLYLFWMECYQVPGFQSDMPDYVNKVAGIAGNYEFPYPILFWTARLSAWLIGAKAAMAITTALFNLAAVVITKYYMNREIRKVSHYDDLTQGRQAMTDILVTLSFRYFCFLICILPRIQLFSALIMRIAVWGFIRRILSGMPLIWPPDLLRLSAFLRR